MPALSNLGADGGHHDRTHHLREGLAPHSHQPQLPQPGDSDNTPITCALPMPLKAQGAVTLDEQVRALGWNGPKGRASVVWGSTQRSPKGKVAPRLLHEAQGAATNDEKLFRGLISSWILRGVVT